MGQRAIPALYPRMAQLSIAHPCHTHLFPMLPFLTSVGGPCLADDLSRERVLRFPPVHVTLGMFVPSPVMSEIL